MRIVAWIIGLAAACMAQAAWAANVGFETISIPVAGDAPLQAGVWYPTEAAEALAPLRMFSQGVAADAAPSAGRHPLIVMSHGTGGWFGEHYDTALALARAGFVVAAVSHTGDTYEDRSRTMRITERPGHLLRLIDYMTADWRGGGRIDARRIGAFGFSAGAFTVLGAAGAELDTARFQPHCAAHPHFYDCLMQRLHPNTTGVQATSTIAHDPRIRAVVAAAPAMGFALDKAALAKVTVPVQLWRAEWDSVLPQPYYAEAVRKALPKPAEYHVVAGADHFDFMAPCSDVLAKNAPEICVPGFDRVGFHKTFNAEVVRFFRANLR